MRDSASVCHQSVGLDNYDHHQKRVFLPLSTHFSASSSFRHARVVRAMPALARWSFAAAAAAPSPRETTRPSRCRAALRRPAKTAAGGEGWTSASFPSSRPRPRHVARAYAPARPGSSDEECVEWDDTCAAGRTETPATPSSRGKPLLCFVNGKSGGRRGAALMELLANRDDIDAVEIVDLTREGPTASLRRHVGVVPDLRVLVCGGDGTVAWVLQAIEELGEVRATERSRRDALVAVTRMTVFFP